MIISTLRSLLWVDFFLYAVIDPRALFRQIKKNDPRCFGLSFFVPLIVSIVEILTVAIMGREGSFFYYKISYGWILNFLLLSFFIVITASLMDLVSQFLGNKGNIKEMITLVNFSIFPKVFLLPLIYIFNVINFAPIFFYILFSFGLFVWSAIIAIQGISEMHSLDFGKSLLIFIFPVIFFGLIFFFIFMLIMISSFSFIFG